MRKRWHTLGLAILILLAFLASAATLVRFFEKRAMTARAAVTDVPIAAAESVQAALTAEGYQPLGRPAWAGAQAAWEAPGSYVVFFAAATAEGSADIYAARAQVDAAGLVSRLSHLTRLTDTPHGEETAPLLAGDWLAFATRAAGRYQTITCLPLGDLERREVFVFAQPVEQVALSWRPALTGQGVALEVVAASLSPKAVTIDPLVLRVQPEDGPLTYVPRARGEFSWLPNLVSRIRELPGVGPQKIAFIENVFFTLLDHVNRWRYGRTAPIGENALPTASPAATAADIALPDLVIKEMKFELGSDCGCSYAMQLGVLVRVQNAGRAEAAPFLVDLNGVKQLPVSVGLAAGETISLWFGEGGIYPGDNRATVDAASQVKESNEANNVLIQALALPDFSPPASPTKAETAATSAPPPTPSPTASSTPTPRPTPSPSPTATPTGQPLTVGVTRQKSVRPDPQRPYAEVEVIEIDPALLQIKMIPGTTEPRSTTGLLGTGVIPRQDWAALVAAFNGGFAAMHGQYGMMVERKVYLPPRDGLATLAVYEDGSIRLGTWGKDLKETPDMVSYRQNCPPLVENGLITAETGKLALWGLSVSDEVYLYRSALGITADGRLIYVVGKPLSAYTLARAMQMAGAQYAMQLDVDEYHVVFITYDVQPGRDGGQPAVTGRKLRNDMHGFDSFFLRPFQLDFFYLTRRPQRLADAVRLAPAPQRPASAPTPSSRELPGQVAFASNRDGNWELYVMKAGQPATLRRLTDHPADDLLPTWSPDGRQLAFTSRRDGNAEIYILDLATGQARRVTRQPSEEWAPTWSPDGARLAYQSDRNGQSDIYVCALDGSGETRLTTLTGNHEAPHWSPDGRLFLFDSDMELAGTVSSAISIYTMNADGSNIRRVAAQGESPRWSPDGGTFAFMLRSVQWQVFALNIDGSGYRQLTSGAYDARYPVWSPDGRWLAFAANQEGHWELYAIPREGGQPLRLTIGANDSSYPAWGP